MCERGWRNFFGEGEREKDGLFPGDDIDWRSVGVDMY